MSRTIADEARALAGQARGLLPSADLMTFTADPQFHGRELEVIEGAQKILHSEHKEGIVFSVLEQGIIGIEA